MMILDVGEECKRIIPSLWCFLAWILFVDVERWNDFSMR